MKRLQQDVGATLFRKKRRSLALTETGEIVLRYGRRMLELNDEVLDTARGASLAGTVRLGCAQDFTETILPQVLLRFTKLYPLVQIEVRIDMHVSLARAVENKQLDLALTLGSSEVRDGVAGARNENGKPHRSFPFLLSENLAANPRTAGNI
jgi:DNA-binding transcriptional LysR family regulator